jgi:hypothetical protein
LELFLQAFDKVGEVEDLEPTLVIAEPGLARNIPDFAGGCGGTPNGLWWIQVIQPLWGNPDIPCDGEQLGVIPSPVQKITPDETFFMKLLESNINPMNGLLKLIDKPVAVGHAFFMNDLKNVSVVVHERILPLVFHQVNTMQRKRQTSFVRHRGGQCRDAPSPAGAPDGSISGARLFLGLSCSWFSTIPHIERLRSIPSD